MKGALPFKVVAVGRFSELECALQSCHESAHGCDFEQKGVLTLKVIEDGRVCWRRWQMGRFPGPSRPLSPLTPCSGPRKSGSRGEGINPEVAELKSHGQQKGDSFLQL